MGMRNYKNISAFFKVLSHPTRLMIVKELLNGKKCVSDIRDLIKARQSNISQHLSLLKLNNIVAYKQKGKMKCYFLKKPRLIRDILKVFL